MSSVVKRRNYDFVDVSRALGILLVIIGHTPFFYQTAINLIYSFHMPLFFILSGFLYNQDKYSKMPFREVLLKRVKAYLVPYLQLGIINIVLNSIFDLVFLRQVKSVKDILVQLYGYFICDTNYFPDFAALWFLLCLFVATMMFWFIMKLPFRFAGIVSVACMAIAYCTYLCFGEFQLPFRIFPAFMGVFFMFVGYFLKKYDVFTLVDKKKWMYIILFVCTAIGLVSAFLNGYVSMNSNKYEQLYLYLCSSVFLSVALMFVCYKFKLFHCRFLIWLGRNTIPVMAFNFLVNRLCIEAYYMTPILGNIEQLRAVTLMLYSIGGCILSIVAYNFVVKLFCKIVNKFNSQNKACTP